MKTTSKVFLVMGLGATLTVGTVTPSAAFPGAASALASASNRDTGLIDVRYRRHWRGHGWRGYGYRPWRYSYRPYRPYNGYRRYRPYYGYRPYFY